MHMGVFKSQLIFRKKCMGKTKAAIRLLNTWDACCVSRNGNLIYSYKYTTYVVSHTYIARILCFHWAFDRNINLSFFRYLLPCSLIVVIYIILFKFSFYKVQYVFQELSLVVLTLCLVYIWDPIDDQNLQDTSALYLTDLFHGECLFQWDWEAGHLSPWNRSVK